MITEEQRERLRQAEAEGVKEARKRKANGHDAKAAAPSYRFKLVPFDQIELNKTTPYLVKDIIPREGLVVIWGPPKCGKSFWNFDALMHIALGIEYRGRRVQQGPVVYVACEGERGLGARTAAFRKAHADLIQDKVPFYLVTTKLDLIGEYDRLIEDIRAQIGIVVPVAVTIDTLNRSLVGSETDDMPHYVKAADAVREAFGCAVILIHHCGVDGTRPRGHTSLTGAADAQLAVKRGASGVITVTVEWLKDGQEGAEITSRLEVVDVGNDPEGTAITSCVIVAAEAPAPTVKTARMTPNQQTMLTILVAAGKGGLSVEEWNERGRSEGIGKKRAPDLYDIRQALKEKKAVYEFNDRWYIQT
jgi:hypothetical protein